MRVLGIDIGGSGIKGAIVNTRTGKLVSARHRVKTPDPSTPKAVAAAVTSLVKHFRWRGPVGCGMPGPILRGTVVTVANLDQGWPGTNAELLFRKATGRKVVVVNDADAAGLAEVTFGAGKDTMGVVILLTLGTGIGSALFVNRMLVPNTELGQIEVGGKTGERRAAARVRKDEKLSWPQWGKRLNRYLRTVDGLVYPDLMVVGGGVSRRWKKFAPHVNVRCKVVPASFHNEAGIVGAALSAVRRKTR
jgi:polyphosphate glucokinase